MVAELNPRKLRWRHNGCDSVSNHRPRHCLLSRLFRRRSKKTSKLRVTGLCAGNSPGTGDFSAQMASYAENVSIWWRHHGCYRAWMSNGIAHQTIFIVTQYPCSGGRFKNVYELLILRALKFSMSHKNIFQCMGKIFCVEFQRYSLKFHTKYLTHTLKDVYFIHRWKLNSSWI